MKLLHDLEAAFNSIGTTMYPDDYCCKLLAWVFIFGGGNEVVTMNKRMFAEIQEAQRRLNLLGGEVPNAELLPLLQKYMREAEYHEKGIEPAEWINTEINERFNIKPYDFKQRDGNEPVVNEIFYSGRPKGSETRRPGGIPDIFW